MSPVCEAYSAIVDQRGIEDSMRVCRRLGRALKTGVPARIKRRLAPLDFRLRRVLWGWRRCAVERMYHYENIDFEREMSADDEARPV